MASALRTKNARYRIKTSSQPACDGVHARQKQQQMSCINLLLTAAVLEGEHNKISMACNYKSFLVQPWPRHRHRDITVEAYTGNEALCMSRWRQEQRTGVADLPGRECVGGGSQSRRED